MTTAYWILILDSSSLATRVAVVGDVVSRSLKHCFKIYLIENHNCSATSEFKHPFLDLLHYVVCSNCCIHTIYWCDEFILKICNNSRLKIRIDFLLVVYSKVSIFTFHSFIPISSQKIPTIPSKKVDNILTDMSSSKKLNIGRLGSFSYTGNTGQNCPKLPKQDVNS
jgi:hypothetical protein